MKKEEFLNELRIELAGLPEEDILDRIEFYSEAIDDRMEEGQTEEEAVRAVGGVDKAVKEVVSDTPITKLVKEKIKQRPKMNWGLSSGHTKVENN